MIRSGKNENIHAIIIHYVFFMFDVCVKLYF